MEQYAVSDYLNADIRITDIVKVWKQYKDNWARPDKLPRTSHGLVYFVAGTNEYDLDGEICTVSPGQVLRLPKGIPYSGRKIGDGKSAFIIVDFDTFADDEYRTLPLPSVIPLKHPELIADKFEKLLAMYTSKLFCSRMHCRILLLELLSAIMMDYAENSLLLKQKQITIDIMNYIQNNFHDPKLTVSVLSSRFFLSETHIRRLFHSELGIAPSEYIALLRFNTAKELLKDAPGLSIQKVAEMSGYSSLYYFSSRFSRLAGMSPTEYRNEAGKHLPTE